VVTTVLPYTDARTRALAGDGFDGVVRVVVGSMYGTGVLLFDGAAVLTAAHLFNQSTKFNSANMIFETLSGTQTIDAIRKIPTMVAPAPRMGRMADVPSKTVTIESATLLK
jgi:hypothetical protein